MKIYHQKPEKPLDSRINLLSQADNSHPHGKKIFKISKFILYLFVVLTLAFLVFSYQVLFTDNSMGDIFSGKINIFQQLSTLAGNSSQLQGEMDDRINILLMGMGGTGHDGPYLTDTMILASIQPSTKKVSMVSIPRDLLVEIPGFGWWKINNANAFGEKQSPGDGSELAKQVVQQVFDIPIHYYVRIDFAGFEKLIDDAGDVKVYVENSFTDYQYPTSDHKYQIVSYEQGWQTMDGETALKFARSRHGNNGEGSDFARSQRQQKIIQAFKDRILSYNFLLSPRKIKKFTDNLAEHLRTDFQPWELVKLAQFAKDIDTSNVITQVLDDSPGGFLYANMVNEAYVLQPKGDDFTQIQYLVKNIFRTNNTSEIQDKKTATVEILNGTIVPGLASLNSDELKLVGYRVNKIGNSPEQNYAKTIVYQLSKTGFDEEKAFLASKYDTEVQDKNIPDWITNISALDSDFLIILGEDNNENYQ